jgi:hypothetical protein
MEAYNENGQVRDGYLNLARRMENEEEDQFDVDHTILDFLVYKAIAAVFEWHASINRWESDLPNALVTMAGEWRSIMSTRYRGRRLSGQTAFRSRLLQFVLLFTHRYHPTRTWTNAESVSKMDRQSKDRGYLWTNHHLNDTTTHNGVYEGSSSNLMASQHRASALGLRSGFGPTTFNYDRPSLQHLLTLFVELTAARARLDDDWQPTSDWFDLAGQFMLHAVIDQHLTNGSCTRDELESCFAFGYPGFERREDEGSDITAMRVLFCRDDASGEELPEWTAIRQRYLKEVSEVLWVCL